MTSRASGFAEVWNQEMVIFPRKDAELVPYTTNWKMLLESGGKYDVSWALPEIVCGDSVATRSRALLPAA